MSDLPFDSFIASESELRTLYRDPSPLVTAKERPELDSATTTFLERCRFIAIGTFDADGNADVSPRGGQSGFIRVLDSRHLAIADLGGNNRLDTMRNIIASGRVAMLCVVPGQTETVRVNGRGWVTTDGKILDGFTMARPTKSAIVVQVDATFIHCAKALMRSGMWDEAVWAELADAPDASDIIVAQGLLSKEVSAEVIRADLQKDYAASIAAEQ